MRQKFNIFTPKKQAIDKEGKYLQKRDEYKFLYWIEKGEGWGVRKPL